MVKLKLLMWHTEFKYNGKMYRKGSVHRYNEGREELSCEPKLGGQFQEEMELAVWIDLNTEVFVK